MSDVDWPTVVNPRYCVVCGRFVGAPGGCQCPGSGMLAGEGGTMNLGLHSPGRVHTVNSFVLFYEEWVGLADREVSP